MTAASEQRRERLPSLEEKPFIVRAKVDFEEKNRVAAKLLTKSQLQARVVAGELR